MAEPTAAQITARLRTLPAAVRLLAALDPGEEVYLVGGTVRDLWLGARPRDLDVVVVGDVASLSKRLGGDTRSHDRFGTATVRAIDGTRYDLARARSEAYPVPGALPEVRPATIDSDLARRDFTVNALALGLSGPRAGALLDVAHAREDLAIGRMRVLHDESFRHDPTRLLRLARYAARLGFAIESHTERLARAAVAEDALATISGPRIGAELELLVDEDDPAAGLAMLRRLEIDAAIADGFGVADPDVVRRGAALLAAGHGRVSNLALAAAVLGMSENERRPLLDWLGLNAYARDVVLQAARRAPELAAAMRADMAPSQIVDVIGVAAHETVALAGALGPADAAERWLNEFSRVRVDIDGGDLIAAGMRPGHAIAVALRAALGAKLDGRADTREAQLKAALEAGGAEGNRSR